MTETSSTRLHVVIAAVIAVAAWQIGVGAPAAWAQQPPPAGAPAEAAAPTSNAMAVPAMSGPLVANPNPTSFDAGPLGPVYVTGAVSGMVLLQSNPVACCLTSDHESRVDLTNAHVIFQKTEGFFQYYTQVGVYSFPALGTQYLSTGRVTGDFFTPLPAAYVKLAPTDEFSIQAGKLFTLIGAEYAFTFQNMNIERGLLWNQEPIISRGVQANYTVGPLALSVSVNDGFYSDSYNWLTGSAAWTINKENTLTFVGGGNVDHTSKNAIPKSPFFYNNSDIFNIIYTYNSAPWTITPYFQYNHVPGDASFGTPSDASTYGGAILANYAVNDNINIAGRFEYIGSSGNSVLSRSPSPSLLYGPGSSAWSLTLTPTYQEGIFFARAEGSYVQANSTTPGFAFGRNGNSKNQARLLFEVGVVY